LREWQARHPPPDIDAVFEPKLAIYEAAAEVAERFDPPAGWLNDRVGEDETDVRFMAAALALRTFGEVPAVAEDVFGDRLEPAARFFVEELFR
jgi:hypothetical protein